jgi:hypothetical protein
MVCHSRAAGFVLGLNTLQMHREVHGEQQLQRLARVAIFAPSEPHPAGVPETLDELDRLVDPADDAAPLEARVRSLLHANCAHCHVMAGGGNSAINLHVTASDEELRMIGVTPQHDHFGIDAAQLVAPGAPERSVLLERTMRLERGRMPPLSSSRVDPLAVRLIREWIAQLEVQPAGETP